MITCARDVYSSLRFYSISLSVRTQVTMKRTGFTNQLSSDVIAYFTDFVEIPVPSDLLRKEDKTLCLRLFSASSGSVVLDGVVFA